MVITTSLISTNLVTQTTETVAANGRGSYPWSELCPIALLAFQSAGQVIASRVLKYNALPTVVLTSLISDLISDPHLFTAGLLENPDRNRKAMALVLSFVGATVAGALVKTSVGYGGALWVATGVKGAMVIAWLIWSPEKEARQG